MQPPWKLVVEDLGRIGHAEIEARPLLLFVGGNNTGKTYLASMMWGLLSLRMGLPHVHTEAHQRFINWLNTRFARREQEPTFEITPEAHDILVQILNDTLQKHGALLAERTFNRPGFPVGKLKLQADYRAAGFPLTWGSFQHNQQSVPSLSYSEIIWPWTEQLQDPRQSAGWISLMAGLYVLGSLGGATTADMGYVPGLPHIGPVFLPASRTGFMLLYRSLASQLVGDALVKTGGVVRPPVPDLTAPAIDFVKLLVGLRPGQGSYRKEAAFLENAMGGCLELHSEVGLNEVFYKPAESKSGLPMQLSSSLVTELAPVVLTLRHISNYKVLIIEEPEAHLHPKLQRRLAQVIVRLVRKGLFVWITTHSENFCQQINNFMKLGAHPRRAEMQQKYGYGENDYLTPDDVGGYQFEADPSGERTVVTEIKKTPQGLVMPTFNRELAALTDEAMDLELPEAQG